MQWSTHLARGSGTVVDPVLEIQIRPGRRFDKLEMKTLVADGWCGELLSRLLKIHHVELAVVLETVGEKRAFSPGFPRLFILSIMFVCFFLTDINGV